MGGGGAGDRGRGVASAPFGERRPLCGPVFLEHGRRLGSKRASLTPRRAQVALLCVCLPVWLRAWAPGAVSDPPFGIRSRPAGSRGRERYLGRGPFSGRLARTSTLPLTSGFPRGRTLGPTDAPGGVRRHHYVLPAPEDGVGGEGKPREDRHVRYPVSRPAPTEG